MSEDKRLTLRHYAAAIAVAVFLLGVVAVIVPPKADADTAAHPYGGCKEAYTMPHSEQAKVCSGRQYLRIVKPYNRQLCRAAASVTLRQATQRTARLARVDRTFTRRVDRLWWAPVVRGEVDLLGDLHEQGNRYLVAAGQADSVREFQRNVNRYFRVTKGHRALVNEIRGDLNLPRASGC